MVDFKKKLGYELNHISLISVPNAVIAIGAAVDVATSTVVLFEKSLALTSDLKRLPIARSINIDFRYAANVIASVIASGMGAIATRVIVYNGVADTDHIIMQADGFLYYNANGTVILKPEKIWEYQGGFLLNDKILVEMDTLSAANVAGANFAAGTLTAIVNVEIDWAELGEKEFKDYILESVYGEQ
jgi:hypothetical protein